MDKKEKAKLREEAEKTSLSVEMIFGIRRLHGQGRTITEISEGLNLYESTVNAALSRGVHPLKEGDDDDNEDQD